LSPIVGAEDDDDVEAEAEAEDVIIVHFTYSSLNTNPELNRLFLVMLWFSLFS
jgi:hypothetical protein